MSKGQRWTANERERDGGMQGVRETGRERDGETGEKRECVSTGGKTNAPSDPRPQTHVHVREPDVGS